MTDEQTLAERDPDAFRLGQLLKLRTPFPPETIGQIPKGGMQLDYVGHAAVTSRLLEVDPEWTWEPFALDDRGLPLIVGGVMWIRMTVCGVTRIGVGDGPDPKQLISDALRNAAMRFGVALDLWSKTELSPESSRATFAPVEEEPLPLASISQRDTISSLLAALTEAEAAELGEWWKKNCRSPMKALTAVDAETVLAHLGLPALADASDYSDEPF